MHPILAQLRRLLLYLLGWIPLAGMLTYLLAVPGGLSWLEATTVALILCLLYAFVCLAAWYPCQATPLERSSLPRFLATHIAAAVVASAIWLLAARTLGRMLTGLEEFRGVDVRLSKDFPLLFGTGVLLYLLAVGFHYVLLAVEASREAEARVMQASVLAREAELRALKAQVNPHFLFNSLNSISALTASDPSKAREMCILLGDFLRRTLGLGEKPSIPLEEEMSLVHAFLAVEKIRYGARLRMEEIIDKEALDAQVPPLLLQPLVENAVGHGIANLVEGGWIRLTAQRCDGDLSIVVENLFDPEAPPRRRNGVGLANVRQRLEARYGDRASFGTNIEGQCFRVAIRLPAETKERAS
ncbi:MAG TPA: histidine kinase [Candidatus Acidoferrales bacterium]|nr:histidine kinase [Candidatus Acidoferrales bacterium]